MLGWELGNIYEVKYWDKEAAVKMTLKKYNSMKRSTMSEIGIDDTEEISRERLYWFTQDLMTNMVAETMEKERKKCV